jgi:hypothetical protein
MTLLYTQGFDHFDDGNEGLSTLIEMHDSMILSPWGFGRFNFGRSVETSSTSYHFTIGGGRLGIPTLYMGVAIKVGALNSTYSSGMPTIEFKDSGGNIHVKVHIVGNTFDIRNGSGTQLFTPFEALNVAEKWFYIEFKIVVSATVGVIEVRVNSIEVANETGLNTKHVSGGDNIDSILCTAAWVNTIVHYDDIYVDDSQFHGDCRIKTFFPDSDSATHTDFVRSGGSNDYECVDENDPNSDTDYIYANVVGDISAFGITTGALGTVKAINLVHVMRKDDAGDRKIKHLVRSNGADYQGVEKSIISDYIGVDHIWELDPDDSAAWTQTKIEAAEFGLEITA